jgi:signal transduction histidine kinase
MVGKNVTGSLESATGSAARFRLVTVGLTMLVMFLALLWIVWRGQGFTNAIRERLAKELLRQREMSVELDAQNVELQEASEAKNRFLSTISHELRTPLTAMLAFADILKRNKDGNLTPRQVQQLVTMRRNGDQLKMLINDLLDFSRIDSGTFKLEPEQVHVGALLREVADSMAPIFIEKRQTLDVHVEDVAVVKADRARLVQVISNLLSNASKYSPEGARAVLSSYLRATQDGAQAVFVDIADAGIGISEDDQKHLFTSFFRANNPETRSVSGSGLGLAIARSIIEMHSGRISAHSVRGKGSTFSFWLPLNAASDGTAPTADLASPAGKNEAEQEAA